MHRNRRLRVVLYVLPALILAALLLYGLRGARRSAPEPSALPAPPAGTPAPTLTTPAPTAAPTPQNRYEGAFELPIEGSTGFATIDLNLRSGLSASSEKKGTLAAGSGFRIIRQEGSYWYVTDGSASGYVAHRYCMINLPDVIPSIVYDNTNAYDSKLVSSGKALPGITGESLYENAAYNPRLGREEFIMPVLYAMAPRIQAAQRAALSDGNSLKIYEAYRPYQVQRKVVDAMDRLSARDAEVLAGISTPPWKVSWFISQGISQHQRGCAIDVSLVKIGQTTTRVCGPYVYEEVTGCTEYEMPTAIHELSSAAAVFSEPIPSSSKDAWRSAAPAESFNRSARLLQKYCTDAGLTPLASEWWHFNDLDAYAQIRNNAGTGGFALTEVFSAVPGR